MNWIKNLFNKYFNPDRTIFDESQQIEKPTILIHANIKSKATLFMIPIRWLPVIGGLLPVHEPVLISLYFKNLYNKKIEESPSVGFGILYPDPFNKRKLEKDKIHPERGWHLNRIPGFTKKGDYKYSNMVQLFSPEIPGTHLLFIDYVVDKDGSLKFRYADKHGLTNRKIKEFEPGAWNTTFHVISSAEYYLYIVASLTLVTSIFALGFSLAFGVFGVGESSAQ